jgi:prephenate dehydratase
MPFASLRDAESTGFGISRAVEDETGKSAAIAGAHTENLRSGFVMSEQSISDGKNNFTHFFVFMNRFYSCTFKVSMKVIKVKIHKIFTRNNHNFTIFKNEFYISKIRHLYPPK